MANLNPLFRGDTREYLLTFKDAEGAAIDITGWKIYFTMKNSSGNNDNNCLIKKDITAHYSPTEGKSKIVFSSSDTHDLHPGDYYYDIQIKKVDGTIYTVAHGKAPILADITRRTD